MNSPTRLAIRRLTSGSRPGYYLCRVQRARPAVVMFGGALKLFGKRRVVRLWPD